MPSAEANIIALDAFRSRSPPEAVIIAVAYIIVRLSLSLSLCVGGCGCGYVIL
jgi:hypothetical protein